MVEPTPDERVTAGSIPRSDTNSQPVDRAKIKGRKYCCFVCKTPAPWMDILAAMGMEPEMEPKEFLCDWCEARKKRIADFMLPQVKTIQQMQT